MSMLLRPHDPLEVVTTSRLERGANTPLGVAESCCGRNPVGMMSDGASQRSCGGRRGILKVKEPLGDAVATRRLGGRAQRDRRAKRTGGHPALAGNFAEPFGGSLGAGAKPPRPPAQGEAPPAAAQSGRRKGRPRRGQGARRPGDARSLGARAGRGAAGDARSQPGVAPAARRCPPTKEGG